MAESAAAPGNRFDNFVAQRVGVEPDQVREFRDNARETARAAFDATKSKVIAGAKEGGKLAAEGVKSGWNALQQWRESRANHRTVENGTQQIDLMQAELEGIDQQVLSVPPAEALAMRGRQQQLRGQIGQLATERQKAASALANYHGAKIEQPRAAAEAQANAIRGLNERMRTSEQARDIATANFNAINRQISILDAQGQNTSVLLQKLQQFGKQIEDHTSSINTLNQRLGTAQNALDAIRSKHGKKIQFAEQLRGIQNDGLSGTLAVNRRKPEARLSAPVSELRPEPSAATRPETAAPTARDESSETRPEDLRAIVAGFAKFIGRLPGQLREMLGKLNGVDKLPEKFDTENVIDRWNEFAKQNGSGVKEIGASDKKTLVEMLPTKTNFVDFALAMRLYLRRDSEEVLKGIQGTVQKFLDAEEAKKSKAA